MEVELLNVSVVASMISVVLEQDVSTGCVHAMLTGESDLYAVVDCLIVSEMTAIELFISVVLGVPDSVGSILQIRSAFVDRVLVEAIETGLVNQVENHFFRMGDGQ